jgi:Zn-dependent protease with chaperone function
MLGMEPPELYVRQHPVPNAYTLAISGRKPFIVLHTALLELLSGPELQAVLAHELGHLKCDHGLWLTVANMLADGTVSLLPVISGAGRCLVCGMTL